MDLKKLSDELRNGKITSKGDGRCEIISPVCRASFPCLVEPKQYNGQGAPRFTLSAIFNIKNPEADAHVSLVNVVMPALKEMADAHKLEFSKVNPVELGVKTRLDGTPYEGYDPWVAWCSFAKYPSASNSVVPCFSPAGKPMDAAKVIAGYYVRVKFQVYKPKKWSTIALGLTWVQLIAEGPTFSSVETESSVDAIPGADALETDFSAVADPAMTDMSDFGG